MSDLQIGIPCGPNSELFANFLIKSIYKTMSNDISYEIILGLNKPNVKIDLILNDLKNSNIRFVKKYSSYTSSHGHADCLNLILDNMTSKWGIFLDADVAVLTKNWEIQLIDQLVNKVAMVGSEYHKTDGKIVDRPNVITCAFDIEIFKKLKIDFMPSMKTIEIDDFNQKIFGGRIGTKICLDTGCDMIEKLINEGYDTKTLKIISPRYSDTHDQLKLLSINDRGEEYHLNGVPISTHIGRSLTRSFNDDKVIMNWKHSVDEWLNGKI